MAYSNINILSKLCRGAFLAYLIILLTACNKHSRGYRAYSTIEHAMEKSEQGDNTELIIIIIGLIILGGYWLYSKMKDD